jgi:cell shape-determining protein MreC
MKRTFLVKRNALLSSANFSWGSIAVGIAVFFLLLRLLAPNIFWYIVTPAFRLSDAIAQASHHLMSGFDDTATLAIENEKLQNANNALTAANESLRQKVESITGLTAGAGDIIAGIIARPPQSPYDTLVLGAGSVDGVALGQEAFGEESVPLGVVTSVLEHFSRVTLFSASGISLNGWVGSSHLPILIKGSGGGALSASVPRSAAITIGDAVSLSGPGSVVLGSVMRVDSDPTSPSVTLRISPAINLFSVTWVTLRDTGAGLRAALSSSTPSLP